MRLRAIIIALIGLYSAGDALAGGPCSGVRGGCYRSSYRSTYPIGRSIPSPVENESPCGQIAVQGYTSADGTATSAYTRAAPGCNGTSVNRNVTYNISPFVYVDNSRSITETPARTAVRTTHWNGTGSVPDIDGDPSTLAPPPNKHKVTAKYTMRTTDGREHPVVHFEDDGDSYWVTSISGGQLKYPKAIILAFDPIPDSPQSTSTAAPTTINPPPAGANSPSLPLPTQATVARVVDGDTLELDNGEKVRLIGVDAPETVHPSKPVEAFGLEASRFTHDALTGELVRLTYDQNTAATAYRDHFGRLLAYIVRARDDLDFNAELVKAGYAHAYTKYPFDRIGEFRRYEREAREQGRGLWAPKAEN
jgi:endonuclease YncB( thermonuclease family)